jgi:hypothetical protein
VNISAVSSSPPVTQLPPTQAAHSAPAKVDRDHDGDNDATESKAVAAAEAAKSTSILDIKA